MFKLLSLNSKGDTIVEVLIAVAIVGSVLVGAFAISNRSLSQIQQAQERTEAQKIGVRSVERLDTFVDKNRIYLDKNELVDDFCIEDDYTVAADCTEGRYTTVITRKSGNDQDVLNYTVKVTWDSLDGNQDNVTFVYTVSDPKL